MPNSEAEDNREAELSDGLFSISELRGQRGVPSTWGGVVFLAVLGGAGLGVVLATTVELWRLGIFVMGASLITGAGLRVVMPEEQAGMLAVRHWLFDALLLSLVGVLVIVLAISIPNQPSG